MSYFKLDFTGKRINRLLVLSETKERAKDGAIMWKCKCNCGRIVLVKSSHLSENRPISCGCYRAELLRKNAIPKNAFGLTPSKQVYYQYKRSAKSRRLDFKLTFNEFIKLITQQCFYCGKKNSIKTKNPRFPKIDYFFHNGLDRINNKKGYVINNVIACCFLCNYARRNLSQNKFYNWIKRIYKNLIKEKKI